MGNNAYFISDLHLGAAYYPDPIAHERVVVRFLESIRDDVAELYLLGDILDYWYEYRYCVPRGYVRFFGALASLADAGVRIYWFIGNHDIWLFDYLRDQIGVTVVDGYQVRDILGSRFFLSHGDGVGRIPAGFRLIRGLFRNRFCQWLYAGVHPRWTIPLAHLWSRANRVSRWDSEDCGDYRPEFLGMERDNLAVFARDYYNNVDSGINYFVFGHEHVLVDEPLSATCRFVILGDWITQYTYAKYDGKHFHLAKYIDGKPDVNII